MSDRRVAASEFRALRHVGIDVGGTKALGVALDGSGTVLDEQTRPTPRGDDSLEPLIDTLAELARSLGASATLGVGVPGLVNRDGVLQAAPNLDGVAHFEVAGLLRRAARRRGRTDRRRQRRDVRDGGRVAARRRRGHRPTWCSSPSGPASVAGSSPTGRWCAVATASPASTATWSSTPTVRVARAVAAVAGSATRRARAWRCWPGRRRRRADAPPWWNSPAVTPQDVRGEHVQAAARSGDHEALAVIDEFGRWVALGLVQPHQRARSGDVRARRRTGVGRRPLPRPDRQVVRRAAVPAAPATDPTCRVRPLGPTSRRRRSRPPATI